MCNERMGTGAPMPQVVLRGGGRRTHWAAAATAALQVDRVALAWNATRTCAMLCLARQSQDPQPSALGAAARPWANRRVAHRSPAFWRMRLPRTRDRYLAWARLGPDSPENVPCARHAARVECGGRAPTLQTKTCACLRPQPNGLAHPIPHLREAPQEQEPGIHMMAAARASAISHSSRSRQPRCHCGTVGTLDTFHTSARLRCEPRPAVAFRPSPAQHRATRTRRQRPARATKC